MNDGFSAANCSAAAPGRVAGIVALGVLVAATAFAGFTPASLVSAPGIGGVATGFAFKDRGLCTRCAGIA